MLAKSGRAQAAEMVCRYGRALSHVEAVLAGLYDLSDRLEVAMKHGKASSYPYYQRRFGSLSIKELNSLRADVKKQEQAVSQMFLDAVRSHDKNKIIEIADAVWFLKDKHTQPVDRERMVIAFLKDIQDRFGGRPTVRQIAQILAFDDVDDVKNIQTPADGWSALRRKCQELGLELSVIRKTRRKKPKRTL